MWKLLTALFSTLLMVGWSEKELHSLSIDKNPPNTIDLDDNETRSKIIAEAIDFLKLHKRDELYYALNQKMPYTGWANWIHNPRIQTLVHLKDGKLHGSLTSWYENGRKAREENFKDGKPRGPVTRWYESGQKYSARNDDGSWTEWYESGQEWRSGNIDGSWIEWHENGQKKVVVNVDGSRKEWHEN